MRKNTISNLSGAMKGVRRDIAERVIKMFHKADGELGEKLGQELGFPVVKSRL
jgi:catalase